MIVCLNSLREENQLFENIALSKQLVDIAASMNLCETVFVLSTPQQANLIAQTLRALLKISSTRGLP